MKKLPFINPIAFSSVLEKSFSRHNFTEYQFFNGLLGIPGLLICDV